VTEPEGGRGRRFGGCAESLEKFAAAHGQLYQAIGDMTGLLRRMTPVVLGVRTFVLDANGSATDSVRVPYKALAVDHVKLDTITSSNATGSVTSPAGGATIAQVPLGLGTYVVTWTVELSGTLGAADANNFQLFQSGTGSNFVVINSVNLAVAGAYAQLSVNITATAAGNFIKVLTIGAGTAGAVYSGVISVQQVNTQLIAPLYIANEAYDANAMPSQGPGVAVCRNNGFTVVNLTGYAWSVYNGSPGDLVTVTLLGAPAPPSSGT
jgi:hypothetical protein